MAFDPVWYLADELTSTQAAYLWLSLEPESEAREKPQKVKAVENLFLRIQRHTERTFSGCILPGEGCAFERFHRIYHRSELQAFAESIGQRPEFLLPEGKPASDRIDHIRKSERGTVCTLILGMAVARFGYKPGNESRQAATGEKAGSIVAALSEQGFKIDPKTVRKWLAEAEEMLQQDS